MRQLDHCLELVGAQLQAANVRHAEGKHGDFHGPRLGARSHHWRLAAGTCLQGQPQAAAEAATSANQQVCQVSDSAGARELQLPERLRSACVGATTPTCTMLTREGAVISSAQSLMQFRVANTLPQRLPFSSRNTNVCSPTRTSPASLGPASCLCRSFFSSAVKTASARTGESHIPHGFPDTARRGDARRPRRYGAVHRTPRTAIRLTGNPPAAAASSAASFEATFLTPGDEDPAESRADASAFMSNSKSNSRSAAKDSRASLTNKPAPGHTCTHHPQALTCAQVDKKQAQAHAHADTRTHTRRHAHADTNTQTQKRRHPLRVCANSSKRCKVRHSDSSPVGTQAAARA
jgi:hypothetical protein